MIIEVKGYILETEFMSGGLDRQSPPQDLFSVWLKFQDSKGLAVISFGVQIPAKEYTEEQFRQAVYIEALEAIDRMEKEEAEKRVKGLDAEAREAALDCLGSRSAESFGIVWLPVSISIRG